VHKSRVAQLEAHRELLEKKVESYQEQMSMFMLMRTDLDQFRKVFDMSVESETMYAPFTPLQKFKDETLISLKKKHNILDLKGVMGDTMAKFEDLSSTITHLKKENEALLRERDNLESSMQAQLGSRERQIEDLQALKKTYAENEKRLQLQTDKASDEVSGLKA
jgi:hypothetical protein